MLLYDSIVVPFMISWDIGASDSEFFLISSYVTAIFWTIDIVLSFMTGYTKDDLVVLNRLQVVRHYFRSWFALDLFVVGSDWISMALQVWLTNSLGRSRDMWLRLARYLKIVRGFRVMAMLHTGRFSVVDTAIMTKALKFGLDPILRIIFGIFKLVVLILWLNHLGSCCWHAALNFEESESESWSQALFTNDNSPGYVYLLGLYWSMTTMFSGSSFTPPTRPSECLLSSGFIIFGVFFVSSLVSALAAMLVEIQMLKRESTQKITLLRKYLRQFDIEPELSVSILKQAKERSRSNKRILEEDVHGLSMISAELHSRLRCNQYGSLIALHPVMGVCHHLERPWLPDVFHYAVKFLSLSPGETIFSPGMNVEGPYLIVAGTARYICSASDHTSHAEVEMKKSTWVCEVAIYAEWITHGHLDADLECEVLMVSSNELHSITAEYPRIAAFVHDYGVRLQEAVREEEAVLSDLAFGKYHDAAVFRMRNSTRMLLSEPALSVLYETSSVWRRKEIYGLKTELQQGKCDLILDEKREVKRHVYVVALHLERPDSKHLVCLAQFRSGDTKLTFELPGVKMVFGETATRAMERLIRRDLGRMESQIQVSRLEHSDHQSPSRRYGVPTRYVRTVFYAQIEEERYCTRPLQLCAHGEEDLVFSSFVAASSQHSAESEELNLYAWMLPGSLDTCLKLWGSNPSVAGQWTSVCLEAFSRGESQQTLLI